VRLTLPKAGALPVATLVTMQQNLMQNIYAEFDYFFFTEADQMLVMRNPQYVFQQLNANEMFTVVPHRLVPYAKEIHDIVFEKISREGGKKAKFLNKNKKKDTKKKESSSTTTTTTVKKIMKKQHILVEDNHYGWMQHSCCMPRQNCLERDNWVPLIHEDIPYINIYGLHVALGNSNFHKLVYRPCKVLDKSFVDLNYCP
jgi:hypothetical protein